MDINGAFPSEFLKAADLQGREVTVTISHVDMKDIGSDAKPVVYFVGKDKGLVLNKTNAGAISQMYGYETDMWADKPITIMPSQTDFQGKIVPCIRVKLGVPQAVRTAYQPPVQPTTVSPTLSDDIPF